MNGQKKAIAVLRSLIRFEYQRIVFEANQHKNGVRDGRPVARLRQNRAERCKVAKGLWLAWYKAEGAEKRMILITYQLHMRHCRDCQMWWSRLKRAASEHKMPEAGGE